MKRKIKIPAFVMAGVVFLLIASFAVATVSTVNMGVLKARVLFLEKIMSGGVDEAEIDNLIARLKKISPTKSTKVEELLTLLGKMESQLPNPVVTNYQQIENLQQGRVYLVGVVTKITEKNPHVFIYVNDVYVPFFNHPGRIQFDVGDLIAIEGNVKKYQDMYEVVPISGTSFWILEQ